MKNTLAFALLLLQTTLFAQSMVKRALFIGNSYTAYNNLPQMVSQCATNTGDQLIFNSNTPGGSSLQGHFSNTSSLNLIQLGEWDYVVLQEQSQRPAFPDAQVAQDVFPYASALNNMIKEYNPCAETMFYMTWGRKNGDAQNCPIWPPVCTYEGMDSLLHLRYMQMAEQNDASVSPVGALWRHIRENHPSIELYTQDESHPSYAGSYAAAVCFYTVIFRKNPELITWNGSLNAQEAQTIRNAAKLVVYDDLDTWRIGANDPVAFYEYTNSSTFQYNFTNLSQNFENTKWYVNGSLVSESQDLDYTFPITGPHQVKLVVDKCDYSAVHEELVLVGFMALENNQQDQILAFPNPFQQTLNVQYALGSSAAILDVSGRLIRTVSIYSDAFQLDLSDLNKGLYVLSLESKCILIEKE